MQLSTVGRSKFVSCHGLNLIREQRLESYSCHIACHDRGPQSGVKYQLCGLVINRYATGTSAEGEAISVTAALTDAVL